ncbi:hypothetical protein Acr_14g0003850 [Actinidia rufa]|uniref:Uncharacterized protein n=1 Tax=Actinidia rufa TaxID=165716 RepID=A0A7J0FRG2_9ERIC|nr:hypothetical protein Acr_14g0003850 [Actinidia rufa]
MGLGGAAEALIQAPEASIQAPDGSIQATDGSIQATDGLIQRVRTAQKLSETIRELGEREAGEKGYQRRTSPAKHWIEEVKGGEKLSGASIRQPNGLLW